MKRRQFLAGLSLGGIGLAAFGKLVFGQPSQSQVNWIDGASLVADNLSPEELPLLRFVSVADTGTGESGQYAVAEAMTRYYQENPYDLVLLAGDNIYNDGEIEKIGAAFERPYGDLRQAGVPFRAVLGNHDIRTANGEPQVRYPGFNMAGRYYTFRHKDVQFFALDTNRNANWEAQLPWLEGELNRSDAPWKVVFGHHQIYSSGRYGVNRGLIDRLTPLFQKYGVQLYVNGHEHTYERTQSIEGTTYLICGAGAKTRRVGRSEWTARSARRLSFAAYEVYRDRIIVRGIGTNNRTFDRGIIPLRSA
jgi:3',5'-cyclic AMP phosphodiesterase CpdA